MKRLRVGIIGLGVGEQHIAGYHSHPACEVVALCDVDQKKLALAHKKYPKLTITKNAGDILKDPTIDVVSIASYDNCHHKQIVQAIKHNKHVFVEKPLCLYEKEAKEIRQLLDQKRYIKLSSNLILRLSPRFQLLKKMIEGGKLGTLFYLEGDYNYGRLHKITEGWRGRMPFYSIIYGGGVHIVDLLLWLTGDTVTEVMSYGNKLASKGSNFRYNDLTASLLKFKSGVIAKVACNFGLVMPHFHVLNVYGTKATFMNGLKDGTLYTSRDKQKAPKKITAAYPGVHKGDLIYSFIDSIVKHNKATVTTEDVFKAMAVCFALERSTHTKGPVKVRYI